VAGSLAGGHMKTLLLPFNGEFILLWSSPLSPRELVNDGYYTVLVSF